MMRKYKILISITLLTIIFLIGNSKIFASEVNYGSSTSTSGESFYGNDGGFNWGDPNKVPSYGSKCDAVRCTVGNSYTSEGKIVIDIKKMDGTKIQDDIFSSDFSTQFLAGTYIMLRVYENQSYKTTATYSVAAKRQVWTCKVYKDVCEAENKKGECIRTVRVLDYQYDHDCNCPSGEPEFKGWRDVTPIYADQCASNAVAQVIKIAPLYVAKYRDSNDINESLDVDTSATIYAQSCSDSRPGELPKTPDDNEGAYSSGFTLETDCSYHYDRKVPICINIKNGKVKYLDNGGNCKELEPSGDYYTVTQDKEGYWKYFIPLNANSANDFTFALTSSGFKKDATSCKDIINNYPNTYEYIITDSNNHSFINNKANAISRVSNGCYFTTTVRIPVVQRFYNELGEDTETVFEGFKGFNFYYKPIDINKPFPNGLTDTSIWYEWNKDKMNPDISESYEQLTYYANTSQNENEIRKYNNQKEYDNDKKDYPYASWEGKNENDTEGGMNKDGTSNFIDNKDIVTRRTEDFYRLGCGPKNTNVNNVFTQPECDR